MAIIVRVALLLAITVTTFSTLTSSVDAQIFRRLRENIRANIAPQPNAVAPQQIQRPQQFQRPQAPSQIAPQPNPQYGQRLTPYSRLTPTQRQAAATPDTNVAQSAPAKVTAASPNPAATTNVRIVTYLDPRTGRTFQRRYIVPPNPNANSNAAVQNRQLATRETSAQAIRKVQVDRIPTAAPYTQSRNRGLTEGTFQQPRFNIPPITSSQPTKVSANQSSAEETFLPELAGPSIAAAESSTTSDNVYSSPAIQPPKADSIASTPLQSSSPVVMSEEIRVDTSVAPASATSADTQPIEISSAASVDSTDESPISFSVLEREETAAPKAIEVDSNSDDDVNAFFGN